MGGNHRLQVFDTDGTFVTMWTDLQQSMDISIDKDGILRHRFDAMLRATKHVEEALETLRTLKDKK